MDPDSRFFTIMRSKNFEIPTKNVKFVVCQYIYFKHASIKKVLKLVPMLEKNANGLKNVHVESGYGSLIHIYGFVDPNPRETNPEHSNFVILTHSCLKNFFITFSMLSICCNLFYTLL